MPDSKEIQHTCCKCGHTLNLKKSFIKSESSMYIGLKKIPICKTCFAELYEEYVDRYKSQKLAIQRICMAFDLYYNDALFETCSANPDILLGSYIRQLNMAQHKGKTFDTTLQEGFTFKKEAKETKKVIVEEPVFKEEPKADPKDIEKWGGGLSIDDYSVMNNHYKLLKNANPNCDSNQEIFITDLCYIKMQMMKAVRDDKPDNYGKLSEQYRKSFEKAGLKTVRDPSVAEDFTIGVNAETIEKYTPAEYYKNKNLFKDHDNLGDYIERFLLRPLRNLMHGTTDRDNEFYVKDEEDVDELADE